MKIKLKIHPDAILAIDRMFENARSVHPIDASITERVTLSLGHELSDMFHTRARQITREANLLNITKKKSLTLKYHQAWALEQIIRQQAPDTNPYKAALLRSFADKLNQKLT